MFDDMPETDSIIFLGIMLLIYETVMIITFYFLAPVVMLVLYSMFSSQIFIDNHGALYAGEFYWVTVAMFAIGMLIPIVWFVLKVIRVESGYATVRIR